MTMGLINSLLGREENEHEEVEEELQIDDEFDSEEGFEDDFDEEPEPEPQEEEIHEWDSAYDFLDDALQAKGFAGTQEFMAKVMMYRVSNSAEYRDRIKHGAKSLQMVNQAMDSIEGMQDGHATDYGEMAEQLSEANQLIEEVDDMTNEEDQMVREGMRLVEDLMDTYKSRSMDTASVDAGTKKRNQSL